MARANSLSDSGVKAPHIAVRLLEILPGFLTWSTLVLPIILSIYQPFFVAYFIIALDLYWLLKSFRMSAALIAGYHRLGVSMRVGWQDRLDRLEAGKQSVEELHALIVQTRAKVPWYWPVTRFGRRLHEQVLQYEIEAEKLDGYMLLEKRIKPSDVHHVVIIATYNETLETLRPTLQSLTQIAYDARKMIVVLAYEERGGAVDEERVAVLKREFSAKFERFYCIKHPDGIVGELKGKGANITYAMRSLLPRLEEMRLEPSDVLVTTLDADHRPDPKYFSVLTYNYVTSEHGKYASFQPIPMFYNNIWDAPAPMRVIATGNSFWVIINSMRPSFLRNFASHSQSLQALIDTDFWSVTSPVEDGHQYWRTFFRYHGEHTVEPLFMPIYQDATLSHKYLSTYRNQYLQLRRWAYGASDIPYVLIKSMQHPEIPLGRRWIQAWRLIEGHYSWATTPFILTFVAWMPLYFSPTFKNTVLAHQLPIVASQIMTVAMIGLSITIWISLISLPPRPHRYTWRKNIAMLLQWALLPLVSLGFGSTAAIDAQTRLMLGKYLGFRVTEKAVKQ